MISISDKNNIEYSKKIINHINKEVESLTKKDKYNNVTFNIMEVCGTHTMSIYKNGIDKLLHPAIKLLSGPGCPVCVTDSGYIDASLNLLLSARVMIATFADMLRVPGSNMTLRSLVKNNLPIQIVYSPLDCIELSKKNPNYEIVFLGIGFETTAPAIALAIKEAYHQSLSNFSVLLNLKTMPNAIKYLILDDEVAIDALICPGHVGAVIGTTPFDYLAKKYALPMVIAGFDPLDIVASIYYLVRMIIKEDYTCCNLYRKVVKDDGNNKAKKLLNEVFEPCESIWRGLGSIPNTGLELKPHLSSFDAQKKFNLTISSAQPAANCLCGKIIKGIKKPKECLLYKTVCTPTSPVGACMVSQEGTCMNAYKYDTTIY